MLFLDQYDQILASFVITTFFIVASREQQIHYTPDMDRVYYFSAWQPGLCVLALTYMDWSSEVIDDGGFERRENILSVILITTNLGIFWLCGHSVDHKRRYSNP